MTPDRKSRAIPSPGNLSLASSSLRQSFLIVSTQRLLAGQLMQTHGECVFR